MTAGRPGRSHWLAAGVLIAVSTAARLVIGARLPLFPDEAYYWTWSTRLAGGYFDHPPMIALLIHAGTLLFGPTALGVRFAPILAGTVAGIATIGIAGLLGDGGAVVAAAWIVALVPLAAAGLVLATPDAPVLAAFAVTVYLVLRAVRSPVRSPASLGWWALTGVALGLAFVSKYTSIFLPMGVLAGIATHRELRIRFAEPGPYVACLIATAVFLPVLFWNASHGWISFAFQLHHGLSAPSGSPWVAAFHHEGDLIAGQAGLVSPILFVLMVIAVIAALRRSASPERWLLGWVSVVSFGFFVYSAIRQRVEPNWPAPAYIGAMALVALHDWRSQGRRWLIAGVGLAAVMSAVIYADAIAPILPIAAAKDPVARAYGWDSLAAAAVRAAKEPGPSSGRRSWIAGDRYQDAAELSFHSETGRETFSLNLTGRPNQYDLWPGFAQRAAIGDRLVLVVDETEDVHPAVAMLVPYFASVLRGELVVMRRGDGVVGARRVYSLDGWRGGWPAR